LRLQENTRLARPKPNIFWLKGKKVQTCVTLFLNIFRKKINKFTLRALFKSIRANDHI
jgi:hypothetical protein